MKSAIQLVILAACLSPLSAVAAAASDQAVPARTVHFADLDLTNAEGAGVLYGRIREAARDVCAPADSSNLQQLAFSQHCTQAAIGRAVNEVNAPLLSSYYLSRNKPAVTIAGR